MTPDFSGYATRANLKCSDGRIIKPEAFAHMDGTTVPLVWQHIHNEPTNVLGHAVLSARPDGVWADAYFNDTDSGKHANTLVQHGDIVSLSIYANNLVEKSRQVFHGVIREVSLVLSGANPGAKIENVRLAHGDGDYDTLEDEAIIFSGAELAHSDGGVSEEETVADTVEDIYNSMTEDQQNAVISMVEAAISYGSDLQHADLPEDSTVQEIFDAFTDQQKNVVYFMISAALEQQEETLKQSDNNADAMSHNEGNTMPRNVFDRNGHQGHENPVLSHSDMEEIAELAKKGGSYKEAFLAHVEEKGYGIENIEMLFPEAKTVTSQPDLIARRTEWVAKVMNDTKHTPFSRIKSVAADITADEARAKGYVKGSLKKDEIIKLLKRVTSPTTIYKKQKLDRDDVVDIVDFDVIAWLKWEMRFMLEEEFARAVLIGDGREPDDADKIDEERIRPIAWDNEMYTHPVTLPTGISSEALVESVLRARKHYKGTGTPTFFTTEDILTDLLLLKDKMGRRFYDNEEDLAKALRVKEVVTVEVMETTPDLLGIIVNLADYTIGADRGGKTQMFEDFDIDFNQQKYLIETRASGALTKPKSAVVIKRTSGSTVVPEVPSFDSETNTITIPTVSGVTYYDVTDANEGSIVTGDVVITKTTDVEARPNAGYNFPHNTDADWTFAYTA